MKNLLSSAKKIQLVLQIPVANPNLRKYSTILFLLASISVCKADTSWVKYFPLSVGDIYVYRVIYHSYPPAYSLDTVYRGVVERDTNISNHRYFLLNGFPKFESNRLYRVDTITGSLYRFNTANTCQYYFNESFVDSLAATNGQAIRNCGQPVMYVSWSCQEDTVTIFSIHTLTKAFPWIFSYMQQNSIVTPKYAKYVGLISEDESYNSPPSYSTLTCRLKGCVINGIVYGDTSRVVGIQILSTGLPQKLQLYQNYPNPFNPSTRIRFDLPKKSFVFLSVYDELGREITILVNEVLKEGSYEVDWNAENYSTGIYFCRLFSGNNTLSKKMIVLK